MIKIKEFLEDEIEIVKNRDDSPFYDGVCVGMENSKELNGKHILFCEKLLRMIDKGDKEMEKSKMVEEMQTLEKKASQLERENRLLKAENENIKKILENNYRLNFDSPLDFAKSIIEHGRIVEEMHVNGIIMDYTVPEHKELTFSYNELEEIADYLLTYCKHNKEDL